MMASAWQIHAALPHVAEADAQERQAGKGGGLRGGHVDEAPRAVGDGDDGAIVGWGLRA